MRSDKELLQLLLDNKDIFQTGLCLLAGTLYCRCKISAKEMLRIPDYLRTNVSTYYKENGYAYYWPIGEWEPREEWLKKEINKLDGKRSFFTILKRWFGRS